MKTRLPFSARLFLGLVLAALALPPQSLPAAETNAPPHARWEPAISAFEAADKTNPPPQGAVVFVGSSSIRLWATAQGQFPSHRIVNRGFGGSQLSDSVAYADRIVIPYRPKVVVLYAGDNDLAAGKTPEQVCADFKSFVDKLQAALPETQVAFLAIKPSPSRAKFQAAGQTANRLIQEFTATRPRLTYVDVATPMLGNDGRPREELFVKDRLHLNDAGYKLWASIVQPVLDKLDAPSKAVSPSGHK
jgi:lysophospholipase L1-like esterase